MSSDRFVVLGLAVARAAWFRSVAQWSNAASIPVEFVKCMSAIELRAHLASGRPFSALLVDGAAPDLDRDLLDLAATQGCAVIVVDNVRDSTDWLAVGASAVVNPMFQRADLVDVLTQHTARIGRGDTVPGTAFETAPWSDDGAQVAMVCGAGGTGASTAAIALAQGLCDDLRYREMVLLADLVLHAEQAMLHDARDVVPGIQELVEAHRTGRPSLEDLRSFTFDVHDRGYQLLLGLRRARNWPTVRPRAFAAALDSMTRGWRALVCDTDCELEGESDGGSTEVEERHLMARTVAARADVVFVVGLPTMKGIHGLVRVIGELLDHSVPGDRIVPVVNIAPKPGRARSDMAKAIATLLEGRRDAEHLASPIFLPERPVDDALRDGVRLPSVLTVPLVGAFLAVTTRSSMRVQANQPTLVAPGSLGQWAEMPAESA